MKKENVLAINELLEKKNIAIVGYSSKGNMPSNLIYDKFKSNGYTTYAVNPKGGMINSVECSKSITELPVVPDAVIICTSPEVTPKVIAEAGEAGVKYVWIHRSIGAGSYSPESEQIATKYGITLIPGGCPMMFIKPDFAHKIIKVITSWQGKI